MRTPEENSEHAHAAHRTNPIPFQIIFKCKQGASGVATSWNLYLVDSISRIEEILRYDAEQEESLKILSVFEYLFQFRDFPGMLVIGTWWL